MLSGFDRTPLTPAPVDELLSRYRSGSHCNLRADTTIFKYGDPAPRFYRVISGIVRSYAELADGRRQVTDFLFEGDLFGLQPSGSYNVTAEAVTNVTLAVYSFNARGGVPSTVSLELARTLLDTVSTRLNEAREWMMLLGRKTAEERLATFIVQLATHTGSSDGTLVAVPMTRGDIADYLGMTLETVCRMFRALRERRIIALPNPSEVRVLDRTALESLANGEHYVARTRFPTRSIPERGGAGHAARGYAEQRL